MSPPLVWVDVGGCAGGWVGVFRELFSQVPAMGFPTFPGGGACSCRTVHSPYTFEGPRELTVEEASTGASGLEIEHCYLL